MVGILSGLGPWALIGTAVASFTAGAVYKTKDFESGLLKIERLENKQEVLNKNTEIQALKDKIGRIEDAEFEAAQTRSDQNQAFEDLKWKFSRDLKNLQTSLTAESGDYYEIQIPETSIARLNCAFHGVMCESNELAGAKGAGSNNDDNSAESGYRGNPSNPPEANDSP